MMTFRKIFPRVAMVLAALALAIPLALAQTQGGDVQGPRAGGRKHGRGHRDGRGANGWFFGKLNLTDAQKQQMGTIRSSFSERTKGLREELRTKQQELRQAQQGDSFNEGLATQKLTEMAALRAKLMGEHHKLNQEMLSVLTPEQKTQLDQMREQRKAKRAEFRARRGQKSATNQ